MDFDQGSQNVQCWKSMVIEPLVVDPRANAMPEQNFWTTL